MNSKLKRKLYDIVFEADTPAGKAFDIFLLFAVLLSVFAVMLESIDSFSGKYPQFLKVSEWFFTVIFTIEYIIRIAIVNKKSKYILSFYGIIDLFSILPTYVGIIIPGSAHSLAVIRSLRLLRVFRIFKLSRYVNESQSLMKALIASKQKIGVFFFSVIMIVILLGTIMYLIEDKEGGFTSIPQSIYWAIVTLTTVGYGDIAPVTDFGKFIAGAVMILGYAIIAIPTGIITSEMNKVNKSKGISTQVCPNCLKEGHDPDAVHCKFCGTEINPDIIP
ncbi:MAG: ion transporter [Bacteroidales bacterium]|nr:ion transporter [Bacteroidales bacterium]